MIKSYKLILIALLLVLQLNNSSVQAQVELDDADTCTDCGPGNVYTSGTDGCFPPCDQCYNTLELKGTTASGQVQGVYFFLNVQELDEVMLNQEGGWEGKTHVIKYLETQNIGTVVLYPLVSDATLAYGTFTESNTFGRPENYFTTGEKIQFLHNQKCATCVSTVDNRENAPSCQCETGYVEVNDAEFSCEIECGHQCESCEVGNLEDCLTCKDKNFLAPACLYPKIGYIALTDDQGEVSYEQCSKKCYACKDTVDNCVPSSEVLVSGGSADDKCSGLNRDDLNDCNCLTGFYDNQGQNKDCLECPEYCATCISLSYCTSCIPQLNRELNLFSGQCECQRGYQTNSVVKDVCKKCYMVSDQCVETCPPNTVPNETQMICETMEYQMVSHKILIYILGVLILIIEIALCLVMKNKLFKNITILKKERTIRKIIQAKQQKMDEDDEKNKNTTLFNTQSPIKGKNRKSRQTTKGFKFSVDKSNLDSTANINEGDDTTPGGISSNNLIESTNNNQSVSPLQDVEEESPHKNKLVKRQRSRFLSKKTSVKAGALGKHGSVDVSSQGFGLTGNSIDATPQMSDNRMLGGQSILQSKRGDISNFEIKEQKEEQNDSLFGAKSNKNIDDFADLGNADDNKPDEQLNEQDQQEKEEASKEAKTKTKKKRTTKRMSKVAKPKKNED